MNIYYYGGTFDPPHIGHKMIVDHFYKIADRIVKIREIPINDRGKIDTKSLKNEN